MTSSDNTSKIHLTDKIERYYLLCVTVCYNHSYFHLLARDCVRLEYYHKFYNWQDMKGASFLSHQLWHAFRGSENCENHAGHSDQQAKISTGPAENKPDRKKFGK